MWGLSLGAGAPNLKFGPLVVLELLAFIVQKCMGSRDPGPRPFSKTFFRGHLVTIPGSIRAKFEVHSFSPYGNIGI